MLREPRKALRALRLRVRRTRFRRRRRWRAQGDCRRHSVVAFCASQRAAEARRKRDPADRPAAGNRCARYINVDGTCRRVAAGAKLPGDARPGWRVLRALGAALRLGGFDFTESPKCARRSQGCASPRSSTGEVWPSVASRRPRRRAALERIATTRDLSQRRRAAPRARAAGASADARCRASALNPEDALALGLAHGAKASVSDGDGSRAAGRASRARTARRVLDRSRHGPRRARCRRTGAALDGREGLTRELDPRIRSTRSSTTFGRRCRPGARGSLLHPRIAVPLIISVAMYVWWERKVHRLDARAHGAEQCRPVRSRRRRSPTCSSCC